MFTTQYIEDYLVQMANAQLNFSDIIRQQRQNEKRIIEQTNSKCDLQKFENRSISGQNIEQALKTGWNDPAVLNTLLCMNNAILYSPNAENNSQIRSFINSLSTMTAPSSAGIVMNPQIRDTQSLTQTLVVKSAVQNDLNNNLIHEYFVGAFGTNQLRAQIPNFAFIMGLFKCSAPFFDKETQEVHTYCQNNKNTEPYIIYENVQNSVPFADFIKTCSFDTLINILCQVFFSITIANKLIDFIHYDLHCNNVLIKTLPTNIVIPYRIDDQTYYLQTQYVATIIDYGQSHIQYEGKHYGFDISNCGRFPNRSHIMADVFKFLCFTLQNLLTANFGILVYANFNKDDITNLQRLKTQHITEYNLLKQTLSYFNKRLDMNNTIWYLHILAKDFFTLPYVANDRSTPLDFLNQTIFKMFPNVVNTFLKRDDIAGPKYGCGNACMTIDQVIQQYTAVKTENGNYEEKMKLCEQMCGQMYPSTVFDGSFDKLPIVTIRTILTNCVKFVDMATTLRNIQKKAGQINLDNKHIKHANKLVKEIKSYVIFLKEIPVFLTEDMIKFDSTAKWFSDNLEWLDNSVEPII